MLRQILDRPISVVIAALTLVILGFFSLLRLPVSLLPTLERSRLVVTVRDAEAAREDLVRQVAQPLERRLLSLSGVLEVHSIVDDGACTLNLETEWQTDVDRLRIDAERRLASVLGSGVDQVTVRVEAGDRSPVLRIAVLGGEPSASRPSGSTPSARTVFADQVLIPELGRLPGAGRLSRLGGASLRPVVRPNAAALAAHGLTAGDLVDRLSQVGHSRPAGRLRDGARIRPLVIREPVRSPAELAGIQLSAGLGAGPVAGPTLGQVAAVAMEEVPDANIFRRDGEDAVLVELHRAPGANAVLLARAARRAIAEIGARAGRAAPRLEVVYDASLEVVEALKQLAIAAALGLLLGTLVLRWMLGSWRPTVALAVVVPASIIAAFGGFHLWSVSLDVVSLAGLALAAGMLIDNSIVVLEAITGARERAGMIEPERGERPEVVGTRQIAMALVASFLTTAVVFLPLIYLRGLARAFFGVQAFAIVTSLAVSLLLSLSLTPVLARGPGRRMGTTGHGAGHGRHDGRRSRGPFCRQYLAVLDRALARPWPVIVATSVLLASAAALLPGLPRELMPAGLSRVLTVEYRLPAGLDREQAERRVEALESAVEQAGKQTSFASGSMDIVSIYRRHNPPGHNPPGRDPASTPRGDDRGEIELRSFTAGARENPPDAEAIEATRRRLEQQLARLPGIDAEVGIRRSAIATAVERSSRRLEIELTAATVARVERLAERVTAALRDSEPGIDPRRAGWAGRPRPAFELAWDDWRLAQLDTANRGSHTAALENQVRAALGGFYAGRADIEGAEPEILIEATRPRELRLVPVRPPSDGTSASDGTSSIAPVIVPLAALARIERRLQPPPTERLDGRPAVRLAVTAPGAAGRGGVSPARIRRALAGIPLGADERVRLAGQAHEMRRSFAQLRLAMLLGAVLVFLTVAALYESLTMPVVVMTTVPIAAAGALVGLWLAEQSLSVMSLLGLILLTGIVVNNAIVLVHRIEQLHAAGRSPSVAIREAAAERYRPILMTTLTTLLGMLPLALLGGEGAELRGALAITVCGGLVTSLYGALLVVPVLHQGLVRRRR